MPTVQTDIHPISGNRGERWGVCEDRGRKLFPGTVAIAVLGVVVASAAALADAAAGRQAYERGDYGQAMAEWQATADKKDPEAEFGLGTLYEFGTSDLSQDYDRAADWYRKAGKQGNVEAEYRLALIYGAGGDNFASDLGEAEKWADLAAQSRGVWGSLATNFKKLLDQVATAEQQKDGGKRAAAWSEALAAAKAQPIAAAPAPPPATPPPAGKAGGCPGWPFPTLPCTEQFPALTGVQPPPPRPTPMAQPAAARPPSAPEAKSPLVALDAALSKIDCASLHSQVAANGAAIVAGTVPNAADKAQLVRLAAQYFPAGRNEITVDIVPPPICRTLVALDHLKPAGEPAINALGLRLDDGSNRLQEGDVITLQVHAPDYPVDLRVDYFSLDGRVVHLAPNGRNPPPRLTARATRLFGDPAKGEDWRAGGAPFGTELISVIATPGPLALGERPRVEEAARYLKDVGQAFDKVGATAGEPGLVATLLIQTSGQ